MSENRMHWKFPPNDFPELWTPILIIKKGVIEFEIFTYFDEEDLLLKKKEFAKEVTAWLPVEIYMHELGCVWSSQPCAPDHVHHNEVEIVLEPNAWKVPKGKCEKNRENELLEQAKVIEQLLTDPAPQTHPSPIPPVADHTSPSSEGLPSPLAGLVDSKED
jgi:hypothetical protein